MDEAHRNRLIDLVHEKDQLDIELQRVQTRTRLIIEELDAALSGAARPKSAKAVTAPAAPKSEPKAAEKVAPKKEAVKAATPPPAASPPTRKGATPGVPTLKSRLILALESNLKGVELAAISKQAYGGDDKATCVRCEKNLRNLMKQKLVSHEGTVWRLLGKAPEKAAAKEVEATKAKPTAKSAAVNTAEKTAEKTAVKTAVKTVEKTVAKPPATGAQKRGRTPGVPTIKERILQALKESPNGVNLSALTKQGYGKNDKSARARCEQYLYAMLQAKLITHERKLWRLSGKTVEKASPKSGKVKKTKAVSKPAVSKPAVSKPAVSKPAVVKAAVVKPAVVKPAVLKPAAVKTAVLKPAVSKAAAKGATKKHAVAAAGKKRRSGVSKALIADVLAVIKKSPGLRTEQIFTHLSEEREAVKAALAKLRVSGAVKTSGQKRSTSYAAV